MSKSLTTLEGTQRIQLHPSQLPRAVVTGLYVHIPFCFHKCHYCDFYSITRQTPERMHDFVSRLLREADLWRAFEVRPETLFFGGGTPSLLPLEEMRRLLEGLRERFDLSRLSEFTVEVNPATANLEYLAMMRSLGVDRISFGAQSFDRDELKLLERHHNPEDVAASLEMARIAGFSRLNLDLIYAIPGQTLQSWQRSLDSALALKTPHISAYGLTYEANTPMTVRKRLGEFQAAPDDLELQMFHHTRTLLQANGYDSYEISNHAQPGEACQHNLMYWTGGNYIGLGPSAASHIAGSRFKNLPHLREWEQSVDRDQLPAMDYEVLSPRQRIAERIMLELRLGRGVRVESLHDYADHPLEPHQKAIDELVKIGLIRLTETGFSLTSAGLNVADSVAEQFAVG